MTILAMDQGTTSSRAVVFSDGLQVQAAAQLIERIRKQKSIIPSAVLATAISPQCPRCMWCEARGSFIYCGLR